MINQYMLNQIPDLFSIKIRPSGYTSNEVKRKGDKLIINDRLTCGSIAGMSAATAKTLVNYGFYLFGIIHHNYPSLILEILLKAPQKTHFAGFFILGMVIDSIIGGTVGILSIYFLRIVGRRYLWYKAFIFGSFIWLIGPVVVLPILHSGLDFNFYYVSLLDHWLLGLVLVTLIDRIYPLPTQNESPG